MLYTARQPGKRYSLAATWLDTSVLLPSGHSPSSPPFFPHHPVYLIQAAVSCKRGMASELRALQQPGLEFKASVVVNQASTKARASCVSIPVTVCAANGVTTARGGGARPGAKHQAPSGGAQCSQFVKHAG
eukprot:scaffold4358_cov137-Isochrysis_galbana.AAC.13